MQMNMHGTLLRVRRTCLSTAAASRPLRLSFRQLCSSFAAAATMFAATSALAQSYPNRQIKFIVPFPPGGATDFIARALATPLAERLGRPVVVENKSGGGGTIGAAEAARSAPDGYTIFIGEPGGMSIAAVVQRNLSYDPLKDFAPVTQIVNVPMLLAAHPSIGAKTLAELLAAQRVKPAELNYGSPGNGTVQHLTMEQLRLAANLKLTHIPYKGGGPAMNDLLGGQIPLLMVTLPTVSAHLKSNKLVGLALFAKARHPAHPELPTATEAGIAGLEDGIWQGIFAPAGTPSDIVQRLNGEIHKALAANDIRERYDAMGAEIRVGSAEAFGQLLRADVERWARVTKAAGVSVN